MKRKYEIPIQRTNFPIERKRTLKKVAFCERIKTEKANTDSNQEITFGFKLTLITVINQSNTAKLN